MTLDEWVNAVASGRFGWVRGEPEAIDGTDIVVRPVEGTFARRPIEGGFLDWYPLAGPGRSRISPSDGERFYASPML